MIKLLEILFGIINEYSKNDPIPEITREQDHLAIFVFGPPAAGKTTFVKNFLMRLNPKVTIVNPDKMNFMRQGKKSYNWLPRTSEFSMKRTKHILQSGYNVIYDTTGNDYGRISELAKNAMENNYKVIFIHVLNTLANIEKRASKRKRPTDPIYLRTSYERTQSFISKYSALNPTSYYIVTSIDNKYVFYKFQDNKLFKRKVDKYVEI